LRLVTTGTYGRLLSTEEDTGELDGVEGVRRGSSIHYRLGLTATTANFIETENTNKKFSLKSSFSAPHFVFYVLGSI
jgi:hypothetical protein